MTNYFSRWESVSIFDYDKLPESSGIYCCLNEQSQPLYIGKAMNLQRRWKQGHHIAIDAIKHGCKYIAFNLLEKTKASNAEKILVARHKPILNQLLFKTVAGDVESHKREISKKTSKMYRERHKTALPEKHCKQCGELFQPKRSTAQFCSSLCRQHHHRGHATW